MLVCLVFFIKGLIIVEPFLLDYTVNNWISIEYISYGLNALLFIIGFSVVEKYLSSYLAKAFYALLTSAGLVVSIGAENYLYQSMKYLNIGWRDWDFFFFSERGIENYLAIGKPGYHWVFLAMVVMCVIVIILHAKKEDIIISFKNWLVKRAKETRQSLYFHLVFRTFVKYIAAADYLELRDIYENKGVGVTFIHRDITPAEFDCIELYLDYEIKKADRISRDIFREEFAQMEEKSQDTEV
jgi:hypothetical protein